MPKASLLEVPAPGDIVWCWFPEAGPPLQPGRKPRPVFVIATDDDPPPLRLYVAYGTSRKLNQLYAGEFCITPDDSLAFTSSGLSYATKFNLAKAVVLPYLAPWFARAPGKQSPVVGKIHPSLARRIQAAARAVGLINR